MALHTKDVGGIVDTFNAIPQQGVSGGHKGIRCRDDPACECAEVKTLPAGLVTTG